MNENETGPRPVDDSAQGGAARGQSEQSTTADQPVSVQSGSAEPTMAHPTVAQPTVTPPTDTPPQWAPPSSAPQSGVPQSGIPQSGVPQSGVPQSGVPQSGSPWQPQGQTAAWPQQTPGYAPAGYGQQAYGQAAYGQQQPAYAGGWAPQTQAGGDGQGQPPGGEPTPIWHGTEGQPVWAAPVDQQSQRPPGRGRKVFVAGAAAVLIALVSGGVGAATALAFDDDAPATLQTSNTSATRIVDRSSYAQIAAAVQDSVVSITTQTGEGSGVVMTADGFIVTNNHVVATAQGGTVTVIFANGKKAQASVVGTDPRTDLAVIRTSGVADLKPATIGSSANLQVGDTALAIGSPLGLEGSVTAGIISAKDRTIQSSSNEGQGQQGSPFGGGQQQQQQQGATTMTGLLQTDAPINPGNSGGALVNVAGEVIGINSAIATQGQGSGNIGLGFAIPSDKAFAVAKDLMAGKKVSHPALGVSVSDAENGGALVGNVTANSAAAKAGLQQGDVIVTVDGKTISDSDDVVAAVQAGTVGQQMAIDYTRDGAKKQVTVTLAESQ